MEPNTLKDSEFYKDIINSTEDKIMFVATTSALIRLLTYRFRKRVAKKTEDWNCILHDDFMYTDDKIKFIISDIDTSGIIFRKKDIDIDSNLFSALKFVLFEYFYIEVENNKLADFINKNLYYIRKIAWRVWYRRKDELHGKSEEFLVFAEIAEKILKDNYEFIYFCLLDDLIEHDRIKNKYLRRSHLCDGNGPNEFFDNGYPYDSGGMWIDG